MKPLLLVAAIVFSASVSFAQAGKFDVATYTAPAGWTVEKDANAIRFSKEANGLYCVISLTRSVEAAGDSPKNFRLLWQGMAIEGLNATAEPQVGKAGKKNGWDAEVGIGPFEKDGIKGAALLTTFTGGGKVVAILAITNSDTFQTNIESFVDGVGLPEIESTQGSAAEPVSANAANSKLIGKWQRSGSVHPSYADPVSWGTAGYTKSRYEFKPDGTYLFTERTFRMSYDKIIIVKESGRYSASGDTLTITPAKSLIQAYAKAGGVDALGALASSQSRRLETATYKLTFHYFSGIQEWNMVLQHETPTDRDGKFSNNTTFPNAWYYDQKYIDGDLTSLRGN